MDSVESNVCIGFLGRRCLGHWVVHTLFIAGFASGAKNFITFPIRVRAILMLSSMSSLNLMQPLRTAEARKDMDKGLASNP